jgi:glycosyltransferase involved in cell wall biosynthesis
MTKKLLFAHDDRISFDSTGRPVSYNYTRRLVDRYRHLADVVTFAVRCLAQEPVPWFSDAKVACIPDVKHGFGITRYFAARRAVERLVDRHDLVVARLPSLMGSWALRRAWRTQKPVLVEFVGCPWDALWNHSALGKFLAPFFFLKNRYLMRRSEYTVYVTGSFLQQRYPSAGVSIACSNVEIAPVSLPDLTRRLERMQGSGFMETCTLATVAALDVPYKGQHLVIEALVHLRDAGLQPRYRLIGGGDPSRLERLAARLGVRDQVEFVGPLPHGNVLEALDSVDIYVQPSRQEGLPRALIEAMSRGCAALGSGAGGIPELLDPACIVEPLSPKAIAAAIHGKGPAFWASQAERNWLVSHDYTFEVLDTRRKRFYDRFLRENADRLDGKSINRTDTAVE